MAQALKCVVCKSTFKTLFDRVKRGDKDEDIINTAKKLCIYLGIQKPNVCNGLIKSNLPVLTYIIRNTPEAKPETFCGLLLQNSEKNTCPFDDPRFDWKVELPIVAKDIVNNTNNNNISTDEPLKVAIITDVHIDPLYEPNGVANCGEPACCRKGQTPGKKFPKTTKRQGLRIVNEQILIDVDVAREYHESRRAAPLADKVPAGYWGDYNYCDTPVWAFDNVVDEIVENHKNIDIVYYVGDSIDHGSWETSYELINKSSSYVVDKIRKSFGDHIPVVPVVGNHESQPANQFAPYKVTGRYLNTTWLYEVLVNKWAFYLNEEGISNMKKYGQFSVVPRPGLKVISLNTNVAYKYNWWLVYDPMDSKKHLDWLVEELHKSELAGEKVHILTHVPPGIDELTYTWTREYNRIINRFSSTIQAEFNGHTHSDEFKIFYDSNKKATNVAWGAGGATTYYNFNLNYKIATFSPKTYKPTAIENYVYNLTEANLTPEKKPKWFQLYEIKKSYNLTDMSANAMDILLHDMVTTNKDYLDLYSVFFSKQSDAYLPECDEKCKLENICKAVITVLWENDKCQDLIDLYNKNKDKE